MSESKKHILQKANAAVLAGDNEGFLACCADNIEWSTVGADTLRGKEAVRAWMKTNYVQPPTFTVQHMVAEDDHVVAIGTIEAPDASGKPVMHAYSDVWRFEAGKMVELNAYVIAIDAR
jgi:ketosteroid isomerase-like protein